MDLGLIRNAANEEIQDKLPEFLLSWFGIPASPPLPERPCRASRSSHSLDL